MAIRSCLVKMIILVCISRPCIWQLWNQMCRDRLGRRHVVIAFPMYSSCQQFTGHRLPEPDLAFLYLLDFSMNIFLWPLQHLKCLNTLQQEVPQQKYEEHVCFLLEPVSWWFHFMSPALSLEKTLLTSLFRFPCHSLAASVHICLCAISVASLTYAYWFHLLCGAWFPCPPRHSLLV